MKDMREVVDLLSGPDPVAAIESRPDLFGYIVGLMDGTEHPRFHCEGDVWQHTKLVIKNVAADPDHDWLDILIALFHDVGKKYALVENQGKHMGGHENHSVTLFWEWCSKTGFTNSEPGRTWAHHADWCIEHHMDMHRLAEHRSACRIMLIVTDHRFPRLVRLATADAKSDLGPDGKPTSDIKDILSHPRVARWIGKPAPAPIISSLDIAEWGVPLMARGSALDLAYKMQINGHCANREHIKNAIMNDPKFFIKQAEAATMEAPKGED